MSGHSDELATPGWALVRTNGMVPDGVYDLDTSSDGYYLNPLADYPEEPTDG